jgi:hypothetical protein
LQKEIILGPDSENSFDMANCLYTLDKIVDSEKAVIDIDINNKWFLFNFGMLFAFIHYGNKKEINLKNKIEKTPFKSFGNVAIDLKENSPIILPKYKINPRKAFLISPVRGVDDVVAKEIKEYKDNLTKNKTFDVIHYPLYDTDQNDIIGTRICRDNLQAEASSGTIKIYYIENSKGSVFDLGMDFMLKFYLDNKLCPNKERKIELINRNNLTSIGPYEKFLLELQKDN